MISLVAIALIVLAAVFAPWLTPHEGAGGTGTPDLATAFGAPSLEHPFGTDDLGRDVFARVLFGARPSLVLGAVVVTLGMVIGTGLGAVAGFAGGWIDEIIMRFTDIILSFPALLLAILLAATLRPSLESAIVAISVTWWPWYTRLVRAQAVSIRERHYVLAARSLGASPLWVLWHHVLPNVLGPVRVQAALDLGAAILVGAALSFLGLGSQPPSPDWGRMVSDGRQYVLGGYWWLTVFPGAAIYVTALTFSFLGDGVQKASDPRARGMSS